MIPDWIAVDWGTTRLRVWAMQGTQAIQSCNSDQGMGALTPDTFEPALLALINDRWLRLQAEIGLLISTVVLTMGLRAIAYALPDGLVVRHRRSWRRIP